MWFDGERQPNTLYVANTSRGKDSTAMLRAIQIMGWPLDMICSVDIWATQDIPAELPPMVAFKDEYDRKVLEWFGVPVTRLCASKRETGSDGECHSCRLTYEDIFYRKISPQRERERERETCNAAETRTETGQSTGSQCGSAVGVNPTSNDRHSRLPESKVQVVYRRAQEFGPAPIKGFPWRKGAWCQDRLKGAP